MKKIFTLLTFALAALALVVSCDKKLDPQVVDPDTPEAPASEQITITVTIPSGLTKVTLTPDDDPDGDIKLAWAETDKIWVIDAADATNKAEFGIDQIDPDKPYIATFTGTAVSASSFNIVYGAESVAAVEVFDCSSQTQNGDASTSHLQFMALLSGVDSCQDIEFSKTWAQTHGGEFEQNGILRLRIQVPDEVNSIKEVSIIGPGTNFFGSTDCITVSFAENVAPDATKHSVTAYAMLPVGNVLESSDGSFEVSFVTGDQDVYRKSFSPGAVSFKPGVTNAVKLNKTGFVADDFAGGTGVDGDPWLVANARQLLNVQPNLVAGEKSFKLIADINMEGKTWSPLNPTSPYDQAVDFDGNNKTISKLNKHLFYVLNGSVYDLTLDHSTITTRGILAEYIQGSDNVVTNVTVSNGSVNSGSSNVGGLIGTINSGSGTCATITNCTVSDTNVTGVGVVGGVIGFADALINMSGCTYCGGTVTATARYAGGMVASTSNYVSVISNCHVEKATIQSSSDRCGGFAGLLHTKVQVKGCTAGTSSQRITVNSTQTTATANVGGFVGVNYSTITKNGDVRNNAYVTVTSSNATTGNSMNIGGFVGYNTGTIEYSDADVVMTGLKGQYIGGFCGVILQSGKIQYCTETGSVSGNNYTGGFVGAIDSATTSFIECSSAGSVSAASSVGGFAGGCTSKTNTATFSGNNSSVSVTSSGSNFGGFIGNGVGSFNSNHATGNVVSTGGGNGGGFAGGIWESSTGSVLSKNYATGNVSGVANLGGLIGYIGGNLTMSNCFAKGNVGSQSNQKYGGLVGYTSDNATYITEGISISNCYATGDVKPSFAGGGLIGRIGLATCSVTTCAAWNSNVTPGSYGSENWSSAAVVGVTFPTCTLTNNYRNPAMSLTAYWVPADMTSFQHTDVSPEHPLTDSAGVEMADASCAKGQPHYPHYPYHGKVESGKTLSELASTTLGWSSDVWDFSGPLPLLK
ncbi:MAG: hypothetical protein IKX67_00695 [Bacteroidales bacterium]|nr:hypothetical protein [Bacteroidales bacterium]